MNYRTINRQLLEERARLALIAFLRDDQVPDDVSDIYTLDDVTTVRLWTGTVRLHDVPALEFAYTSATPGLPMKAPRAIIRERIEALTPGDIDVLRKTPENKLVLFHHTQGRFLRNTYGLWRSDNPYLRGRHPDDLSHDIMLAVWRHVIAKHGALPEDREFFDGYFGRWPVHVQRTPVRA